MALLRQNSIHLTRIAGIDLYLHWSWFIAALYMIQSRNGRYASVTWNVLEYLALFAIVLTHEFGHALACRQVGGTADRIVLWPLGGVAYVNPPQRPGATLWSIAAGPMVNVALLPVLQVAFVLALSAGWAQSMPNAFLFIGMVRRINMVLLVFNILPVYPLDGGQILRSLLWFVLGRARSLMAATVIGMAGVIGFIGLALWQQSVWLALIAAYMFMNCWSSFKHAQALRRLERISRRPGFACPSCRTAPPAGNYWKCAHCQQPFDIFQGQAICPNCQTRYNLIACLDCGQSFPVDAWKADEYGAYGVVSASFHPK